MGQVDFLGAVRKGDLVIVGPKNLGRLLPTWFKRSPFAPVALP